MPTPRVYEEVTAVALFADKEMEPGRSQGICQGHAGKKGWSQDGAQAPGAPESRLFPTRRDCRLGSKGGRI